MKTLPTASPRMSAASCSSWRLFQLPQERQNALALVRGADPGAGAHQERKAQLGLQGLDDVAQARLGVAQLLGGAGQVAQVDGGEQGDAFVLVHDTSFPSKTLMDILRASFHEKL